MSPTFRRRTLPALCAAALAAGAATAAATAPAHAATPPVFNVKNYGATGNGSTIDTNAINKAIAAASAAGGGEVLFPSGTYESVSIHLKSNVELYLDSGATIRAAAKGFDAPESNNYSQYQDYGHSHFHDSLIWGDSLSNVTFAGSGTIDGGGHLTDGTPSSGQADHAIAITRSSGITFTGITVKNGGWIAVLVNGIDHLTISDLNVQTAKNRDGIDVINTENASVTDSTINSVDDSLVFKSDYALGRTYPNQNVTVTNVTASSNNNAFQFGSETCGNFSGYTFSHLTVNAAGKAGLGIVSMDGAQISNVSYTDVTMKDAATPIFIKIGDRGRCPGSPGPGSISGITFDHVTGTHLSDLGANYTSTITGMPGHPVSNVTVENVDLTVPGGDPASDATIDPPTVYTSYVPRDLGTRPSYGWWLRNVSGIDFTDDTVGYDKNDDRPAFIGDAGSKITLNGVTVQRGSSAPYDVGFISSTGSSVTNSKTTSGAALKIHTS
ncbi:MAG TPA: glycosyl hydrolase family 28 protein [Actinospica sp.]|jgi:polygalacturonase|nr:glycosyl hydrolase family 28 protein [Actinospica sp.]